MAAGGSVVHPAVPCILVTPICPHVLSFRSMVFPDHVVLRCYVPDDARTHASVAFDGKHRHELQRGDSVQIQMSSYPVPTINRGDHSSDWLDGKWKVGKPRAEDGSHTYVVQTAAKKAIFDLWPPRSEMTPSIEGHRDDLVHPLITFAGPPKRRLV